MNADLSLSDATLERLPPQSLEAEQAVLGALLVSGDGVSRIVDVLDPEYFYRKAHQVIYAAMLDLYEANEPLDIVTISQYLKDQGKLENVGGRQYITDLSLSVATTANLEYYAKVVQEKAILRQLIKAGTEIVGSCYEETDADIALDRAEHSIFTLAQKRDLQSLTHIKNIVETSFQKIEERYENRDALSGVPSGFYDLDAYTSGFQPSDLVIIAARPSMGKCLAFDSEIVLADGSIVTIEELYKKGTASLLTLVGDARLVFTAPSAYVDDGIKPVFKVATRTGRSIETTLTHPFLTIDGWKKLSELKVGTNIGVPRHMPVFGKSEMRECELKLLAYLIGDGCLSDGKANFSNASISLRDDFSAAATEFAASSAHSDSTEKRSANAFNKREFGHRLAEVVASKYQSQHQVALMTTVSPSSLSQWISGKAVPNQEDFNNLCAVLDVVPAELAPSGLESIHRCNQDSLVLWLSELGLWGLRSNAKFIPSEIFKLNRKSLALFLNRLFATHGLTTVESGQCQIRYATESKTLAQQVQHLLLRFGVISTLNVRTVQVKGTLRPSYQLDVTDSLSIQKFVEEIGIYSREAEVEALRRALPENCPLNNETDVLWDEIVAIDYMGRKQVYDLTIPETHNFVANDICVHNTAFVLNLAQNAAVEHNIPVAIFSLEMSKESLVMRMLCAEAEIDANRLRSGHMHTSDWTKLATAMGRLGEAPIYIDDSALVNALEIRAKCRRLKSENNGLGMVIIDYIQLMQGRKQTDNRVQEVSEISRSLKQLAREINTPVLALSQLSRAVESRQNKRPMLSDLRESGCLTGDSQIFIPESGAYVRIDSLIGNHDVDVLALNQTTLKLEPKRVTNAFCTGVKPVFKLTSALNREIKATANHKFLTIDGWKRLDELSVGTKLACPRTLATSSISTMSSEELALLGYLIGDGCTLARHAIQYTTTDLDLAQHVVDLAKCIFNESIVPRLKRERNWYQVYLSSATRLTHGKRNPVAKWLHNLGVWNLRSWEKVIPTKVFEQSTEQLAVFLRHLWSTDGTVSYSQKGTKARSVPRIFYATSSKKLAQGIQSLLLRFGINARVIRVPQSGKGRDQFHVSITGAVEQLRFLLEIGIHDVRRQSHVTHAMRYLQEVVPNTNRDLIPKEAWRVIVEPARMAAGLTTREMQFQIGTFYCGSALYKSGLGRDRAAIVARVVKSSELASLSQSDVYWDEIVSIEPLGEEPVYDLTVEDHHNFVANNIVVHNSIEQDADLVMFIYRDEYYNPESERRGEAEIIIAKQRNGPVGSIDLLYQASITRFLNKVHNQYAGAGME